MKKMELCAAASQSFDEAHNQKQNRNRIAFAIELKRTETEHDK